MANDSVRTVWSKEMEARLVELQRQKDEAIRQYRLPINQFFEEILRDFKGTDINFTELIKTTVDRSIYNAEKLRDFLKPFDGRE